MEARRLSLPSATSAAAAIPLQRTLSDASDGSSGSKGSRSSQGSSNAVGHLMSAFKSKKNPFSRRGVVTRVAEHVPLVNNAMQGMHHLAGDEEAAERAKSKNPLRKDGHLCTVAERIPVMNNVVQAIHKARGQQDAWERAHERNPLGRAGYITQAGEHIPGVADAIRCIHKFRGHTEDAERARAYSLRKLVSKGGAVTKLAELLPGTNLLAAVALEMSGNHEEARRAINILRQYKDVASADGALAKLAELFPGTDVIAFGLQVNGGHYASALRALCKTRWVEIRSKRTAVTISMGPVRDWTVLDVESDLELQPKVRSLAAGLMDLGIHMMDFNRQGERRICRSQHLLRHHPNRVRGTVKEAKVDNANEVLSGVVDGFDQSVPDYIVCGVESGNWAFGEWVPEDRTTWTMMRSMYLLFPPLPFSPPPSQAPSAQLLAAVQETIPYVVASHGVIPLEPDRFQVPERDRKRGRVERVLPEAAAAASCLSLAGCVGLGLHTGPLACFAGCLAGAGALHRKVKENLIPWLNAANVGSWRSMVVPVAPLVRNPRGGAAQPFSPSLPKEQPPTRSSSSTSPPWSSFDVSLAGGAPFSSFGSAGSASAAATSTPPEHRRRVASGGGRFGRVGGIGTVSSGAFASGASSGLDAGGGGGGGGGRGAWWVCGSEGTPGSQGQAISHRSSSSGAGSRWLCGADAGGVAEPTAQPPPRLRPAPLGSHLSTASERASPAASATSSASAASPGLADSLRSPGSCAPYRGESSMAAGEPTGTILEWPVELVDRVRAGELLRDYFVKEMCTLRRWRNWLHPGVVFVRMFDNQIRRFLNDALDGQAVPLIIPITVPQGLYPGIQTWLPEIRVMLVLWLGFADERMLRGITAAVVDGVLDQVANVVKDQVLPPDVRDLDPRLADFTEPIDLKFDIALRWATGGRMKIEFNNMSAKLVLPA